MLSSVSKEIRNHLGERLDYSLHPAASESSPLVILGHGVTGNKDRPFLVALAQALAENGFSALRLSFAGNGASEGRFEDSTVSKQVGELQAVIAAFSGARIGYVGHSMGAAVGVLCASQSERIKFLVSLAGMAHTAAFAEREFGTIEPGRGLMWEKPECPLSRAYVDDMKKIGSVTPAARRITAPWLLVHGTADDVVPPQDSHDLFAIAQEPKQIKTIEGADHVFSEGHTEVMVRTVVDWMRRLAV